MEGLLLLGFGFIIGYMVARRTSESDLQQEARERPAERRRTAGQAASERAIMLREIDSDDFAAIVGPGLQRQLRNHYQGLDLNAERTPAPEPAPSPSRTYSGPKRRVEESRRVFVSPRVTAVEPAPASAPEPVYGPPIPAAAPARRGRLARPLFPSDIPKPRPRAPREPIRLDPALVLLYLGAFLIVAAGLIYASFNWEQLEGGQKLALLAAATVGFIAAGLALLGNARVRPAAETFIGIGALLIPSNIIAAITILSDTPLRATLALQIGAALATLLYTVFSYRPGAIVYRYAAVISASLAIGVLPASLGAHRAWALPVLALAPALVIGVIDRAGGRATRFRVPALRAAMGIPAVALVATPVVGLPATHDTLVITAILAGMAVTFGVVAAITRKTLPGHGVLVATLSAVVVASGGTEAEALRLVLPPAAGLMLLFLAMRGPRFYRTTLADTTAVASVVAFGLTAMAPTAPDLEADRLATWGIAFAPGLIAAGWALVAVARQWAPLMLPAIVLAYLSHGLALDRLDLLDSETSFLAWLLPGTIVAATIPALTARWPKLPKHRSHSFFLWLGFGAISLAMGPLAALMTYERGMPVRALAISYMVLFTAAAVVAAQQHRRRPALVIAAGWLVGGVLLALEPVPVSEVYRWPLLAGTFAALVLTMPRLEGTTWWRRPANLRWPMLVLTGAAGVSAIPMAITIGEFLTEVTTLDDAQWWPVYATVLAVAAAVFGLYARYRYAQVTTGVAAVSGMLATALVLRAGALHFDPDPLIWPAIGIGIGLAILIAADRLDRMGTALAGLWSRWAAAFAALLLLLSLTWAVAQTAGYINAAWSSATVPHGDEPLWWTPFLAAYIALAVTAHRLARTRPNPLLTVGIATSAMSAALAASLVLSAGMERFDPEPIIWTAIGIALAALVAAVALRISDVRTEVARRWSTAITVMALLLATPSLLWAIPNTLTYIASGWFDVDATHGDDFRWWLPMLAAFVATAALGHLAVRHRLDPILTVGIGVAATAAMLAASIALSGAMRWLEPDPLVWPAAGIALGVLLAAGALALGSRRTEPALRWGRLTAGYAGGIIVLALVPALTETARYIASGWNGDVVRHGDAPAWWLPLLGAYILLALAANGVAWRYDLALLTPITAAAGLIAVALATRMVTTDTFTWTVIGMAIGLVAPLAWATLLRRDTTSNYALGWIPVTQVMALIGVAALAVNIAAGIAGEIDPWRNVALYAVLSAGAAVASVRLDLPQGLYASTAALGLAVLFTLLAPQVDPLDGLLIPAGIAWVLVIGSLAPRLTRPWSQPLEYSGYVFGAVPAIYPFLRTEQAWDIDSGIYQRVTLAIVSFGLIVGLTAIVRRSPVRASVAIPLVMAGAMRQVAAYEPESWQPYAVVLAITLAATGLAWHRTRRVSDPLYALAGAILIGVPFMESFTIGGTTDAFIAGGYGILVVVLGLVVRRQEPVAVGVIGVTLVVLRQLVDTAMAFESWQVLGTAGAILLFGGTIILLIRDSLRRWWDSGRRLWEALG